MQTEEILLVLLLKNKKKKTQFSKVWYPPVPSTPKDVKFGESAVEEPLPFQTALSQMCTNVSYHIRASFRPPVSAPAPVQQLLL